MEKGRKECTERKIGHLSGKETPRIVAFGGFDMAFVRLYVSFANVATTLGKLS